ncbi:MAG: sugar kinase [Chthoniobacteraceae bacterium]
MAHLVTFGELLLRLNCPGIQRFSQIDHLEVSVAGAEANVAVAATSFGHQATFVSALPANGIGELARGRLKMCDVKTDHLLAMGARMGTYYLEAGALQRPSEIIYDRAGSAFATAPASAYDWPQIFATANWFHTSGINPSLSREAATATRQALQAARAAGVTTSFDLNYREKLWSVAEARPVLESMLPFVDLLIAGRGQLGQVLGVTSELDDFDGIEKVAAATRQRYGIPRLCIPRRGSGEATLETRSAYYADATTTHRAPWMAFEMLEPLGGGDAFAGVLISALLNGEPPARATDLAVAAACVKHSIPGDFLRARVAEVESFLAAPGKRGIKR